MPSQFTALPLDILSPEASASYLLDTTAGYRTPAPDDPARAAELAALLGHLALALELAAACIRVTGRSIAEYIAHWHSHTAEALDWYVQGKMDYPLSLARTWQSSVDALTPGTKFLLQQLAWCAPDPIPITLPNAEVFTTEQKVLIAELTSLSLAKKSEDGSTFTLHRLIQEITRQQQSDTQPPPALLTALEWFTELVPRVSRYVRPWSVIEPLVAHAQTVALHAADHHLSDTTDHLLDQSIHRYDTKAQHQTAEPLKRRALVMDMESESLAQSGVTIDFNFFAQLLNDTSQLAGAEPLYRNILAMNERDYGPAHPEVAKVLKNLAQLLHATSRPAEAEPMYRRALAIDEEDYGPAHPEVAKDLNNLAALLQDMNRLVEAEPLLVRAVKIVEDSLEQKHPYRVTFRKNLDDLREAMAGAGGE